MAPAPKKRTRTGATSAALRRALIAPRIVIERVSPCVEGGRYPAKAVVGQTVHVEATIFADGHETLGAELLFKAPDRTDWQRMPLRPLGNDRWRTKLPVQSCGIHVYTIEAWIDTWGSYRDALRKLRAAGAASALDVREGTELLRRVNSTAPAGALTQLLQRLPALEQEAALDLLLADATAGELSAVAVRSHLVQFDPELRIDVERRAAGFASWYELFPRSQAMDNSHGTLDDVVARLPMIAAMGFDVLYLPPIHPIGQTRRKGRNNRLQADLEDPGSPYAIGSLDGGHDAVHPQLGGIEALRRLRDAAASYGIELALDFAIQCSPDHPWLQEHPGWFNWRVDGSLRCAENPPKKYEDIVNVDFYAEQAMPALWLALRDVVEYWVGEGVRSFRVDNPHTKPLPFWEWLIADIRSRNPEVLFLAEAFTRPAMMYRLGKIGFAQSYTYFTWRNHKQELTEYLRELTQDAPRDFYRPHFFVNTPDINPYFLQNSGRAGFLIRAALATTLSGLWGLYSGFELCEAAALPGREEYLDSEKYQLRHRDWAAPGNIVAEIARLNHLRREYPALQTHLGLHFGGADNDAIMCYAKAVPDDDTALLVAVSLDPHHVQEAWLDLPLAALGFDDSVSLDVEELMSAQHLRWQGRRQHWRLLPQEMPFAIWRLRRAQD